MYWSIKSEIFIEKIFKNKKKIIKVKIDEINKLTSDLVVFLFKFSKKW